MFAFIVAVFCCVLWVPAIQLFADLVFLQRDGALNLVMWVPGIKLAKCPIIQGFASSLLGTQLPVAPAVAFYKAYLLIRTAFSCHASQALSAAHVLLLTSLKKKKKELKACRCHVITSI